MVACVLPQVPARVFLRRDIAQRLARRPRRLARLQQRLHGQPRSLHRGALAPAENAGLLRRPPSLLVFFRACIQQLFDRLTRELAVLPIFGREVGRHRQGVRIHLAIQVRGHVLFRLLHRRPFKTGILQRPPQVRRDPQHVAVVTIGGAFVDEICVRLPASVRLLLPGQPLLRPFDQPRIHVMHACHIGELHQPVCRQNLVGGRIAEPRESSARALRRSAGADSRWQ